MAAAARSAALRAVAVEAEVLEPRRLRRLAQRRLKPLLVVEIAHRRVAARRVYERPPLLCRQFRRRREAGAAQRFARVVQRRRVRQAVRRRRRRLHRRVVVGRRADGAGRADGVARRSSRRRRRRRHRARGRVAWRRPVDPVERAARAQPLARRRVAHEVADDPALRRTAGGGAREPLEPRLARQCARQQQPQKLLGGATTGACGARRRSDERDARVVGEEVERDDEPRQQREHGVVEGGRREADDGDGVVDGGGRRAGVEASFARVVVQCGLAAAPPLLREPKVGVQRHVRRLRRSVQEELARARRLELPVCRLLGRRRADKAADHAVAAVQRAAAERRDKGWRAGAGRADRAEASDTQRAQRRLLLLIRVAGDGARQLRCAHPAHAGGAAVVAQAAVGAAPQKIGRGGGRRLLRRLELDARRRRALRARGRRDGGERREVKEVVRRAGLKRHLLGGV